MLGHCFLDTKVDMTISIVKSKGQKINYRCISKAERLTELGCDGVSGLSRGGIQIE